MDHHNQIQSSPTSQPPQQPEQQEEEEVTTSTTTSCAYRLLLKLMSKRRTWVCLFILVYGLLLSSSWNLLDSILTWYRSYPSRSAGASASSQALYASLMLGAVFGIISMAAALAVALPSMLITWITILVLLTFFGKPRRLLVVEGRKITGEIARFVVRVLVKEGNLVAALCAVLWYFVLYNGDDDDETS